MGISGDTRPAYLSKKLSYPLPAKGGDILHTIQDAQDYLLTLPSHRQRRQGAHGGSCRQPPPPVFFHSCAVARMARSRVPSPMSS